MTESSDLKARRAAKPEFRNINVFKDVRTYRMPPAALVSIFHRVSGMLLFLALPLLVWLFEQSLVSEIAFGNFQAILEWYPYATAEKPLAPWLMWTLAHFTPLKVILVVLFWAYMHHLIAGLRHVYTDISHRLDKTFGRLSAYATFAISLLATLCFAVSLFGLI